MPTTDFADGIETGLNDIQADIAASVV